MHEQASKMELGDKETLAICIQASVTCYLHVIHRYTRMVYKIVSYAYGTYIPYAYGIKYAYGTEHLHVGVIKILMHISSKLCHVLQCMHAVQDVGHAWRMSSVKIININPCSVQSFLLMPIFSSHD